MPAPVYKYRFGPYEVRVRTRELFKHGIRLKLRRQPFQVLQVLVERAGDVVTREELRQMLWPAETFVDFEHGLNTSVKELRRVLSDSASEPRYVETIPKLGYRIVAAVETEAMPSIASVGGVQPLEDTGRVSNPPFQQPNRRWRRIWPYGALAGILAAVLAGGALIDRQSEPETSMPLPLTGFPGLEQAATWSPDGRQVAFAWTGETHEHFDLYVLQPGSSQTLRLTADAGDSINPAWSPDGRWIAYVNRASPGDRCSLNLVSPLGGPIHTVLTSETAMGRLSWLPDGRALVLEIIPGPGQPAAVWVVWPDTGRHRPLTSPPVGIPGDTGPSVSPDGRAVAFCRATFWRTAELYLLDLKADLSPAGPARRITDLGFVEWPAWTPDGSHILFNAHRGGAGIWQVERSGLHVRPILGVPATGWQPAIAKRPGGYSSLVFTSTSAETKIWRFRTERPDEAPSELAPSSRNQGCPRYSDDGKRVAFHSDRTGYQEIWVANADGSQPLQLTNLRHPITEAPDWSPSGEQIAFVSQDRANRQIFVVSASGGPAAAITDEQGIQSGGGWSRDGRGYYYTSTRSGRPEVWEAPRGGGQPEQITVKGGVCGFESARGIFYYWKGEIGRRGTLMRRTPEGDQPLPLASEAVGCRTAASPKGFYFVSAETGGVSLYDESMERSERVFPHAGEPVTWFTVSPDGHWLAMNSEVKEGSDLMIMEHFR
jgi:Tol biopolymer transport system component/DNA-binding winged helix-turn-helix (wHTH) protein